MKTSSESDWELLGEDDDHSCQPQIPSAGQFLFRGMVVGGICSIVSVSFANIIWFDPNRTARFMLIVFHTIECLGVGGLFCLCSLLVSNKWSSFKYFIAGVSVGALKVLAVFALTTVVIPQVIPPNGFVNGVPQRSLMKDHGPANLGIHVLDFAVMSSVFAALSSRKVAIARLVLASISAFMVAGMTMFVLPMLLQPPAATGVAFEQFFSFVILGFMMWYPIKCGDEEAACL